MTRHSERGFTLLELLLALAIMAALLAITFGGLRVGLAAWRQGEDRAQAQEHARNLQLVLARAVAGAHPYRAQAAPLESPVVFFLGEADRLAFVTVTPPFPGGSPVAFTAVTIAFSDQARPGLVIRQKVLPNYDPFEAVEPLFRDPSISRVRFRYLSEKDGSWVESWDATTDGTLPRAVEITLTAQVRQRTVEHPPLTVAIPAYTP